MNTVISIFIWDSSRTQEEISSRGIIDSRENIGITILLLNKNQVRKQENLSYVLCTFDEH